jgi:hypothetical protein
MDLNENQIMELVEFLFKNQPQKIGVQIFKSPKLVNFHKFLFLFFLKLTGSLERRFLKTQNQSILCIKFFHLLENDDSLKNKKTTQQIGHNMCF